jgi:hypothetical protein
MVFENLQDTNTEDDRNTDLLRPAHLQSPNNPLWQDKHCHIGDNLHGGRCKHHIWQRVTFAGKVEFPDRLVGTTLHIQKNDAKYSPQTL